ncbi:MAG: hypothetical protein JO125_00305, partial [Chloroflexi bacterium]|nr:hypothetical protein [Chloroflexota bacterium]
WSRRDKAFSEIAKGIRKVVEELAGIGEQHSTKQLADGYTTEQFESDVTAKLTHDLVDICDSYRLDENLA